MLNIEIMLGILLAFISLENFLFLIQIHFYLLIDF